MMTNLILFINSFLSYLLVVAVFVAAIGVAIFSGIKLRKKKDSQEAFSEADES
jgi:hypothetical protein